MKYSEIYKKVSEELNIPEDIVGKVYKAYWKFIRDSISSLPLKEDLSEEDFNKLRTNFNIPHIGKLTCTYDRYKRVKQRLNYKKNDKGKEDQASI